MMGGVPAATRGGGGRHPGCVINGGVLVIKGGVAVIKGGVPKATRGGVNIDGGGPN